MNPISLYQLNEFIKRVIALNFQETIWVTAEIAQMGITRGHRYLDLVEHGEDGIIAQLSATLWQGEYKRLVMQHGATLDQLLTAGTQVKLGVVVQFHERFGLKANITEVDLEWTFGHLELLKRKTLEQLQKSGLLEANKRHKLPAVLQNIAVISSEKAAGLQDFVQQLRNNAYGYAFKISLYDTLVQGAQAETEMMKALLEIVSESSIYDVVVIIRGGGARLDLAVFDQLEFNTCVAKMPLPVICGIGHETDQTVLDLVAHTALKTPTAVAEYLIQHNMYFEGRLRQISHSALRLSQVLFTQNNQKLSFMQMQLNHRLKARLQSAEWEVRSVSEHLPKALKQHFRAQELLLDRIESRLVAMHPENTLKRGYTITRLKGKAILAETEVPLGAEVETETAKGKLNTKRISK